MALPLSASMQHTKRDEIRDAIDVNETGCEQSNFPAYINLNRVVRRGETTALCTTALGSEGPLGPSMP
jgi:hypothetical protein